MNWKEIPNYSGTTNAYYLKKKKTTYEFNNMFWNHLNIQILSLASENK